jgi:hypothetical protein
MWLHPNSDIGSDPWPPTEETIGIAIAFDPVNPAGKLIVAEA